MTILTAILLLADAAQAGAAYKEALDAVRLGKYEDAVARLQEAIRHEPRETDRLQYRDKEGRHKEAYYPHYVWAQARALQARGETGLGRRRELLREAIAHLELTQHPQAATLAAAVKDDLAEVEKTAATPVTPDASIGALRRRIEGLCDQERFVEASRAADGEKALLDRFPAERTALREAIGSHRKAVVARYARSLEQGLETVAATPALEREAILRLLRPALPPATVSESPEPRFVWLARFLSIVPTPEALETSAAEAVDAGLPSGARAALAIARDLRIRTLTACRDDRRMETLLADAEQVHRRCDPSLRSDAYERRLQELRGALRERTLLRDDLGRWLGRAERALEDPATMSDPVKLTTIANDLSALEQRAPWGQVSAAARARGLFARAVLEAVAAVLEGAAPPQPCPGIKAARTLDPEVAAAWKDRLSPKLRAWLDRQP